MDQHDHTDCHYCGEPAVADDADEPLCGRCATALIASLRETITYMQEHTCKRQTRTASGAALHKPGLLWD